MNKNSPKHLFYSLTTPQQNDQATCACITEANFLKGIAHAQMHDLLGTYKL